MTMPRTGSPAPLPASPPLSDSQLKALAELGEERTAEVGETLFRIGDQRYPFIAIVEGEVSIRDAAGQEIVSHGPLMLNANTASVQPECLARLLMHSLKIR